VADLPPLMALACQVLHNLAHQHHWTALELHTHAPTTQAPLPRPIVSGLPPHRVYMSPTEQVALLKKASLSSKACAADEALGLNFEATAEREWVLPTRLHEKWTLGRLAAVFEDIGLVPPAPKAGGSRQRAPMNPYRTTKRLLLGTVDTDSTIVYYIVHDGIVKPRQN